jgi:hypothetical protein
MAQDPYLNVGSPDIFDEVRKLKARFQGINHKSAAKKSGVIHSNPAASC